MRTFLRSKATLLFLALGLLLAVPAVALANNVINANLINYISQNANYTAGSANGVVTEYWVQADTDGCDPGDGGAVSFKLSVKRQSDGADVSASSFKARLDTDAAGSEQALNNFTLTLNGCAPKPPGSDQFPTTGVFKKVVFTSDANLAAGQYKVEINGSTISDPNDDVNEYSPDNQNSFLINVSAPPTGGGGGTGGDPCANVTVADPTFDTSGDADSNGWFNEDEGIPTVSATSAGNTVTYATDAAGPFGAAAPTLGQGETTVYAKATDANGCVSAVSSYLYKVDTVDPTITPLGLTSATSTVTGTDDNGDDWYNHSVTHQFSAEDATPGSGFAAPNTNPYIIEESSDQQEGRGITFASGPVSDVAGNTTASVDSDAFNIDLTVPSLNISGAADGTYDVCSIPSRPTFAPSDTLSGLSSQGDSWTTPLTETGGIGTYTYSAHATDYASNNSVGGRTYNVVADQNYTDTLGPFSGILQPVNIGTLQRSSFKLGSTVPIKFRVMCGATPVSGLKVSLWLSRIDGTADPVNEAVATTTGTTGTLFRYDAASGQYIFNLSTKGDYVQPEGQTIAMGQGTWYLSLQFAGTNQKVQVASIDLKK